MCVFHILIRLFFSPTVKCIGLVQIHFPGSTNEIESSCMYRVATVNRHNFFLGSCFQFVFFNL